MVDYRRQKQDLIENLKQTLHYWENSKSSFSETAKKAVSEAKIIRQRKIKQAHQREKETIRKKKQTDKEIDDIIYMLDDAIKKESYNTPIHRIKRTVVIASALAAFFTGGFLYSHNTIDNQVKPPGYVSQPDMKQKYHTIDKIISKTIEKKYSLRPQASSSTSYKNTEYWYFPIRGDTLSKISMNVSGTTNNWRKIQSYNKLDSELIEVNQPLRLPSEIVQNTKHLYKGPLDSRLYKVREHDTWNSISRRLCGNNHCAQTIVSYNRKYNPRFSSKLWAREYLLIPK